MDNDTIDPDDINACERFMQLPTIILALSLIPDDGVRDIIASALRTAFGAGALHGTEAMGERMLRKFDEVNARYRKPGVA